MKITWLLIALSAAAVGLAVQLISIPGNRRAYAKADRLDEICAYAKHTLELDARIVRSTLPDDTQLAEAIILRVNGDRIGDGAQHLQWCMRSSFPVMAWAACRDNVCFATILEDAAKEIP